MNPAFNKLSVSQLKALVVILEVLNLSRAAIVLGTSQSALSRYLAQAREAFGDPLLVRQGREYVPTERGAEILHPLKQVLQGLMDVSSPAAFAPASCERRFCIAASDYVAQYILPGLLGELATAAPGVSLDFRTWQADRFDWLAKGEVDLAISMIEQTPADYHGRILGEDMAVCCMRTGHPVAGNPMVTRRDYLAWPHLRITLGGDKDSFIDAHLRRHHVSRDVKLTVPFFSAALAVLEQSDTLLTVPEHIARKWGEQAAVCHRPLEFVKHQFRYWVVWHSRTQSSPEQQWFRHCVYRHCRASQFLSPGAHPPAM